MNKLRWFSIIGIVAIVLAACGGGPAATEAPAANENEAPAATEPAGEAPALADVAREDTVILGWSISSPIGVTNPWAVPGYTHQEGNVFMWEALEYYGIFGSSEIPWLADSMEYNAEFTQLTIKLNPDAAWSDGTPLTSKDVLFTFNGQLTNDKLPYHSSFDQFVQDMSAPDDQTVIVNFKLPAPRFKYEVLTFKFDTGIPIVPEHVLGKEGLATLCPDCTDGDYTAFPGGLDIPHSGPYNLVQWDANQKIYDLREDWWAVKAGRIEMPQAKRIVMVNIGGQVGQNMDVVIQRLVNNEFDAILDVRASVAKQILDSNSKVTTHSGSDAPYGYLDWWPNSLWSNTQIEPFSDPNVRRAMCDTIDRNQINEVVYDGAEIATVYPFPLYPNLQKFADSAAVQAEFKANASNAMQTGTADLAESEQLMTAAGFTKNADGLWEKDGATVPAVINGFEGIHSDIVPVLVEMLRAGGFDASIDFGTEAYNNMADGKPGLYMFGHGASTVDPYAVLDLYSSRNAKPIGTTAGNNSFARYSNPDMDALLDIMAPLSADDPAFQEAAAKAMGIYWKDTIDCPIIQWLHRIPYNQTYWTNWPTAANPSLGENGAFWAETGMLVITNLKKAQ
ncbi:MAG TPA: ABC transporter substrate-binding protein [Anaerolineales bacterium]|nr:ABC transporter substrate-binding protein [Anaerolineales bacterium]